MKDWEPIELKITFEKLEQIIRADEREKIAQAIEAHRYTLVAGSPVVFRDEVAQIARSGGGNG